MSSFCCVFRFLGDFSLIVSFPILISRILSSKAGCEGVSLRTQVFHLIVFLARYADTIIPGLQPPTPSRTTGTWLLHWYTPAIKAYLMVISAWVILAMAYRTILDRNQAAKENRQVCKGKGHAKLLRALALYIIPSLCVGYVFNFVYPFQYMWAEEYHNSTFRFFPNPMDMWKVQPREWVEVFWSFSHILAAFAEIPQYQKYYAYLSGRTTHDWLMMSYCIATVSFRQFYIIHWIHRFYEQTIFDPVAVPTGLIETIIFWVFVAFCRSKLRANARSSLLADEESKVGSDEKEVLFDAKE